MPNDPRHASENERKAPATSDAIDAEIADHLATAAERLQAEGLAAEQAQLKAKAKFGDATLVRQRCYWIQHGDSLMFRSAVIALLSVLCIGLTITAVAGWRAQSQLSGEVRSLTEQLKLLAEKQAAAPAAAPVVVAPAEPRPLVIDGRIYDGAPSRPLADAPVIILDVKDGSKIRTVKTNANGEFESGPLAGGDYSIVAQGPGRSADGRLVGRFAQSAPISAYPGVPVPKQELDVSMHLGALRIETSRPLPKRAIGERYVIDTRLLVKTISMRERSAPWTAGQGGSRTEWPLFASTSRVFAGDRNGETERWNWDLLTRERISNPTPDMSFEKVRFPAGTVSMTATILADVWPVDYQPQPMKQSQFTYSDTGITRTAISSEWKSASVAVSRRLFSLRSNPPNDALKLDNDDFWWMTKGLGQIWLRKLRQQSLLDPVQPIVLSLDELALSPIQRIPIEGGRTTRLRVEIPADLEDRIQQLVDDTTAPDEFAKLAYFGTQEEGSRGRRGMGPSPVPRDSCPFFQPAGLTVAGTEPLQEPADKNQP